MQIMSTRQMAQTDVVVPAIRRIGTNAAAPTRLAASMTLRELLTFLNALRLYNLIMSCPRGVWFSKAHQEQQAGGKEGGPNPPHDAHKAQGSCCQLQLQALHPGRADWGRGSFREASAGEHLSSHHHWMAHRI